MIKKGGNMDYRTFVEEQIANIRGSVGNHLAINALSGGVDSSVVTALGHKAIGDQLKTVFIENGLMRQGEPERVVKIFSDIGIPVRLVDAKKEFLGALKGLTDPEEKRNAITRTFYSTVFGKRVREGGVGEVPKLLSLPLEITRRIPFPGPALATRIVGEVTEERIATVRAATAIVEEELGDTGAFQYMAILLSDRATGIVNGKREFGQIIVVRCIHSLDARTATPVELPWEKLRRICERITAIPDVNRCLYDLTPKPPATIEYI